VGSTEGSLTVTAGEKAQVSGSDLVAAKDVSITGTSVTIDPGLDQSQASESHDFKQSGVTVALNGGMVSLAQNVVAQAEGIHEAKGDSRILALRGMTAYAEGSDLGNRLQASGAALAQGDMKGAAAASGIRLSVSYGQSQSHSESSATAESNTGSVALAGRDLSITATEGDITAKGSTLGGQNVSLAAANDINLLAAVDRTSDRSSNHSSSTSVGVSFGVGSSGFGLSLDVAASRGKGMANGDTKTQQNTIVAARDNLVLMSGKDTNLMGAQASGQRIEATVGGDLNLASTQDTGSYAAHQESAGFAVSIPIYGAGSGSASVSASQVKTDSDYASVHQQTGLFAGAEGFGVQVAGNTDLQGAVIASTADAGKNALTTGTLTTSDLQNRTSTSSDSSGLSVGTSAFSGKYEAAKAVVGNLADRGSADQSDASTARSAIAQGSLTIADGAAQQALTGQTVEQTVASLDRQTEDANRALVRPDIDAIQQSAQDQQADHNLVFTTVTAYTDRAYTAMFKQKAKIMRVVCLSEPCTWDPKLGIDPNRDKNIALVEISPEELRSMSKEEKAQLVIATNGVLNETQRAGELANQNATPNDRETKEGTGNSKPDIVLVASPYSGNALSDFMVAGYEKYLAPTLGYTNPDVAFAETVKEVSTGRDVSGNANGTLNAATMLGHSRGTIVERNALEILKGQGFTNDQLKVLAKGPAVTEKELADIAHGVNKWVDPEQPKSHISQDWFTYSSFPNDPVATLIGGSPNGQLFPSLQEIWPMFNTPTSAHSSYGTGAPGCDKIEIPYSYDDQRQQHVNDLLKQGPLVPNRSLPAVDRTREQMTLLRQQVGVSPVSSLMQRYFSRQPLTPDPTDARTNQLNQLGQTLINGGQ